MICYIPLGYSEFSCEAESIGSTYICMLYTHTHMYVEKGKRDIYYKDLTHMVFDTYLLDEYNSV